MSHGRYRLKGFDYRANRWYFVTTVTARRDHAFGRIEGLELAPSAAGRIVEEKLAALVQRRPEVRIPVSVVMPNHVHLLIGLANEGTFESPNRFGKVAADSLATVIGGWKSGVSRRAHAEGACPTKDLWQRRFRERVLRDVGEWEGVADYILCNPANWHLDPRSGAREPTDEEINDWRRRLEMSSSFPIGELPMCGALFPL